jgi:hypothetical protein
MTVFVFTAPAARASGARATHRACKSAANAAEMGFVRVCHNGVRHRRPGAERANGIARWPAFAAGMFVEIGRQRLRAHRTAGNDQVRGFEDQGSWRRLCVAKARERRGLAVHATDTPQGKDYLWCIPSQALLAVRSAGRFAQSVRRC